MTEPKHTPLPWKVTPMSVEGTPFDYPCIIESPGICDIYRGPLSFHSLRGRNKEEAQANAALIVKAVNNHDKLVEALKESKDLIGQFRLKKENIVTQSTWETIEAALKEAEGGEG